MKLETDAERRLRLNARPRKIHKAVDEILRETAEEREQRTSNESRASLSLSFIYIYIYIYTVQVLVRERAMVVLLILERLKGVVRGTQLAALLR